MRYRYLVVKTIMHCAQFVQYAGYGALWCLVVKILVQQIRPLGNLMSQHYRAADPRHL
jgi:hypothetical protein